MVGLALLSAHPVHAGEAGVSPDQRPPAAAGQCWSPQSLAGRPAEKAIVKGTRAAMVAPPDQDLITYVPAARGAIRRVDLPPGIKRVALTFDLCEQPYEVAGYDAAIVNLLRQQNVKATFFSGGKWLLTHAEHAQQLIADPLFEVGNHAWEHRNLRLLIGRRQSDEIGWAQAAYEKTVAELASRRCLGRDGNLVVRTRANARMSLFRFPYGACNAEALEAVSSLGLLPIQWDVSSGDPTVGLSAATMASEVIRRVRSGSIVLFHGNGRGWNTAAALAIIVPALRARGYEFATVTELLTTKGATWRTEPICYDAKPGDTDRHDALARRLSVAYDRFTAKMTGQPTPQPPNASPAGPPAGSPAKPQGPARRGAVDGLQR
ncbi:MAG: polysaccharide deacetylase family protein [Hyphomicrobium sp.]